MNIKITGAVGKQEILELLAKALNTLEEAGVDEFKGVNLYVTPYVSGEEVVPQIENGPFAFKFISSNKHVNYVNEEDGSKKMVYKKCPTSDIDLNGVLKLHETIKLPTEKSLEQKQANQLALANEERRKRENERNELMLKELAQEALDHKTAKQCREWVRETLGLSVEEFKSETSGCGWLSSGKYIKKYSHELTESRAFRVSMKIKDSRDFRVYLFSENASLIYEGVHAPNSVQRN